MIIGLVYGVVDRGELRMFILDLLNNFMNPYLYRTIRKQFCEALNYHPIHGGWERPIVMNQFEFRENVKIEGESWWEWKKLDSEVPSIEEMISEIEFRSGLFSITNPQTCKRLENPIFRIAKAQTKSGKQIVVPQFHLPLGNQYDQRITKDKSLYAFQLIQSGFGVSDGLKKAGVNWNALIRHTSYEPVRKVNTHRRVRKVIQLYRDGMTLTDSLSFVEMSSRTFWLKTGGIKRVLQDTGVLEWEISKLKGEDGKTNKDSTQITHKQTR